MGLSMEFVIGNIPLLVEAFRSGDVDPLDDPTVVTQRASLSLHLIPHDLDLLSRAIGIHSGQTERDLRPSLAVLVDHNDCGVLSVAPEWVAYVAALGPEQMNSVTETWFAMMSEEHREPDLSVTADALTAVAELLSLCKYAQETKRQVIHTWYL